MDEDESSIVITAWPAEPIKVDHEFDEPVPLTVGFDETPARVRLSADDGPLQIDMGMRLSAEKPVPVCITICEPICARSRYTIGITIFDRPVADITIQGETRFFNCNDKVPDDGPVIVR